MAQANKMTRSAQTKKLAKAFSLIELLVIVTVLAVVGAMALVSLPNVSVKGRALKVIEAVEQIRSALAEYKLDNGFFPTSVMAGESLIGPNNKIYLKQVPVITWNPDICSLPDFDYEVKSSGQSYQLNYCLAVSVNGLSAGEQVVGPSGHVVPQTPKGK